MKDDKGKPVYGVLAVYRGSFMEWNFPEKRDRLGIYGQVPLSDKQARQVVAERQAAGVAAMAYHYGWALRGFRSGEDSCEELCRNDLWIERLADVEAWGNWRDNGVPAQ